MGLFSNFFGGAKSESNLEKYDTLDPQQRQLLASLASQAQSGLAGPAPSAPAMSVPTTGQEKQYFDWVNSLSSQTALKNILSGTPGYDVGPEYAERYFEESVRPTYMREFNETVLPGIRNAYSGPGFYGSARMGEEAQAGSDLAYQLAKSKADLLYSEENAKRSAIENAYGRVLPGMEQYTSTLGQAGLYERNIQHEQVAEDLQRFLMGEEVDGKYNPAYNPNIQLALAVLGIPAYGTATKTTSEGAGIGYGAIQGLVQNLVQSPLSKIGGGMASQGAQAAGTQVGQLSAGQSWPTAGFGAWGGADYLAGSSVAAPALGGATAGFSNPYWAAALLAL